VFPAVLRVSDMPGGGHDRWGARRGEGVGSMAPAPIGRWEANLPTVPVLASACPHSGMGRSLTICFMTSVEVMR
jgi:hypothetical protein